MSPSLSHLIIFNPTISRPAEGSVSSDPAYKDADPEDHGEIAQMLFHWSSKGSKREEGLKQMGLAKGLMGFIR